MRTFLEAQDVFDALKKNDAALVKSLLEENPALVNARDNDGRTLLHWAARAPSMSIELMKFIIDKGADVDYKDANDMTALHAVCQRGEVEAARLLMERGGDVRAKDKTGNSPVSYALYRNSLEILKLLIDMGKIGAKGDEGRELLHRAAAGGRMDLVKQVISMGADLRSKNNNGGTLLHSAAEGGLVALMRDLAGKGFDPNAVDRYFYTPLRIAVQHGHLDAVMMLVENGADINARSRAGVTAYWEAGAMGKKEIAEFLASKGADQSPRRWPPIEGEYVGQKKPGKKAELFAPGIISSPLWEHSPLVFSRDGREVYWSVVSKDSARGIILTMKMKNGYWPEPKPLPFSQWEFRDICPNLSSDGKRLYFTSCRPVGEGGDSGGFNIWVAERSGDDWSNPQLLDTAINAGKEARSVFTNDGTITFGSWRAGGIGFCNIYISKLVDGRYTKPEILPKPVNSEYSEMPAAIGPDGQFIVFESTRPGGLGATDFYVSFLRRDGSWGDALNLGPTVNSPFEDWFGGLSPDGKCFFFVSNRNGNNDLYWVDAKIIEHLRPRELKSR